MGLDLTSGLADIFVYINKQDKREMAQVHAGTAAYYEPCFPEFWENYVSSCIPQFSTLYLAALCLSMSRTGKHDYTWGRGGRWGR